MKVPNASPARTGTESAVSDDRNLARSAWPNECTNSARPPARATRRRIDAARAPSAGVPSSPWIEINPPPCTGPVTVIVSL